MAPDAVKRYIASLLTSKQAIMTMGFVDTDIMIICLTGGNCGLTFTGDSANGAWHLWYTHLATDHPGWGG